jgi:hypothetical protein
VAAAGSVATILVVMASALTAMLRAGAIVAAAVAPGAIVIVPAMAIADALEAAAPFRAAPVGVEAHENIVDAAFHLSALAGAADPAFGAFVIGAAFGANRTVVRFAADQAVTAIELLRPISASRCHLQQTAFVTKGDAAFFSIDAGVLAAYEATGLAWHAATLVTEMARVAVRVVTAFGAEELITGTAGYLPQWAGKDLRHTGASFAGFAALAVRIDAAFRADQLTGDTTGHPIGTDDGVGFACAVVT